MSTIHKDLQESGLADIYNMSTITDNLELGKFLGKKVRYKKELCQPKKKMTKEVSCISN